MVPPSDQHAHTADAVAEMYFNKDPGRQIYPERIIEYIKLSVATRNQVP